MGGEGARESGGFWGVGFCGKQVSQGNAAQSPYGSSPVRDLESEVDRWDTVSRQRSQGEGREGVSGLSLKSEDGR